MLFSLNLSVSFVGVPAGKRQYPAAVLLAVAASTIVLTLTILQHADLSPSFDKAEDDVPNQDSFSYDPKSYPLGLCEGDCSQSGSLSGISPTPSGCDVCYICVEGVDAIAWGCKGEGVGGGKASAMSHCCLEVINSYPKLISSIGISHRITAFLMIPLAAS